MAVKVICIRDRDLTVMNGLKFFVRLTPAIRRVSNFLVPNWSVTIESQRHFVGVVNLLVGLVVFGHYLWLITKRNKLE